MLTVDVFWADPALAHDDLLVLLDDHERDRHGRFVRRGDRDRYLTAHALARVVLAERCASAPEDLEFDRTCTTCGAQHGKPQLVGDGELRFSLSHSGSRVVVAVSAGHELGVDVETLGSASGLASELLDGWELDRLPDAPTRDHALTVWWARKEAVLKATGDGLSVAPTSLRVSPPDTAAELLSWHGRELPELTLTDLNPGSGYAAALAVRGGGPVSVTEHQAAPLLTRP